MSKQELIATIDFHEWLALKGDADRYKEALEVIVKLGALTLLGGSGMDSERAYQLGAHNAFGQAAEMARSALQREVK